MSDAGMNEPVEPVGAGGEPAMPGPGAQLAAHRKQRGWSIEHVASQLNLAPRQIRAIENDDYKALPPTAVLRGFVRAYAKLLKVDAAPLLTAMAGDPVLAAAAASSAPPVVRRTVGATFSPPRFPEITDRRGLSGKHIAIAVAVILLGAGLWVARQAGHLPSLSDKGSLPNLSGAAGEAVNKPAPVINDAAAPVANPGTATESSTTGTVVAEAPPPVMPPIAEPNPAPQDVAPGQDALVLKAREDSWIEIKGPGNRIVLSRIVKAGETETVEVKEPLSVVIGNASGVDGTLRGDPLPVKTNTKSNVARLSLK
jgi:cytoskeleton protein RodZ